MPSIPDDADPSITLVCSVCGEEKSVKEYFRKRPGYVFSWCKPCHAEKGRASRARNPDRYNGYAARYREANREKICEKVKAAYWADAEKSRESNRAQQSKPEDKAHRLAYRQANRDAINGRSAAWKKANAERKKEADAAYREANRDEIYARKRAWIEANPEAFAVICAKAKHRRRDRESVAECTLTADEWAEILRIQENRCGRCRKRFGGNRRPHKDHIVPLSKGGGLTARNTQGLCARCNNEKYLDDTDYRGILPGFLDG